MPLIVHDTENIPTKYELAMASFSS